jgi:hypothetical protein
MVVNTFNCRLKPRKRFSNKKSSLTRLQFQRNTTIDVLTTFSSHFRGEVFLFSLSELARGAGMCVSKERPISRNENQNKPEKKNKQQVKQNRKYLQRVYGSVIR